MTIAQILSNETLRQREFPVCAGSVYLAHAGVCPLPRRVAEAIGDYAQRCAAGDQEELLPEQFVSETRALAARLLRAQPSEVALVGPTSMGLSLVAGGLRFHERDNVVVYFDDYPSNVYPWMALANRGVEVRFLKARALGQIHPQDVLEQLDGHTRLVALASCHFVSGWRLDHQAIGRMLRERNVLFCLDAIQTLGAFPTTVEQVDFLAADAHKWLLGPCAAGLFYVRQELQEQLHPAVFGWHNIQCPNYTAQEALVFRPDARRYEAGSANLLGLVGLRAALELVLELGVEAVAAELLRKRKWLLNALQAKGYSVCEPTDSSANAGGITSFYRQGTDLADLHRRLAGAGIITSLRADRAGQQYLRLSPHYYNTDAELEALLARL